MQKKSDDIGCDQNLKKIKDSNLAKKQYKIAYPFLLYSIG